MYSDSAYSRFFVRFLMGYNSIETSSFNCLSLAQHKSRSTGFVSAVEMFALLQNRFAVKP